MKPETKRILFQAGLLILLTIPFWVTNADIKAQSYFYDPATRLWAFDKNPVILFLYQYATLPGLLLAALAVIVFAAGFAVKNLQKHRKAALLIMLTLLLGPGLVINIVLKNYTGRPRPREIKEFNGAWGYRPPLVFGTPGRGYSFPCGHCSMGILFYTLYLVYRKKKRVLAYSAMAGSFLYGGAIGLARMAQGAHFLSDVLWACGLTVLTAEIVYFYLLKGDSEKEPALSGLIPASGNPLTAFATGTGLLSVLVFMFVIATPYYREMSLGLNIAGKNPAVTINSPELSITISGPAEAGKAGFKAGGFGIPRSSYGVEIAGDGRDEVKIGCIKKGLFSELNGELSVALPGNKGYEITASTAQGDIAYTLGCKAGTVTLFTDKGDVDFEPAPGSVLGAVFIKTSSGDIILRLAKGVKIGPGGEINLSAKNGKVIIATSGGYFQDLNKEAARLKGAKELFLKSRKKGGVNLAAQAGSINIEKE